MDEIEGTLQVYSNDGIPLLLGHTEHETVLRDSGIIDKDVDRTKLFLDQTDNLFRLCEVGGIACIALGLYAFCSDFRLGSLAVLVDDKVGECNICTFFCEPQCDSLADTACSTCDEGCLSFQ